MASGRGCFALAIVLTIVDIQRGGGMAILTSVSQARNQLNVTCTLWHKQEEAEGIIVFLCKNRLWDCSPKTSLKQLRLQRYLGTDGGKEGPSQLTVTINPVTLSANGTYQCCATTQKPKMQLRGHFFSILVTATGNYTVTGLKGTGRREFSHSNKGALSSSPPFWVILVTGLLVLQACKNFVPEETF